MTGTLAERIKEAREAAGISEPAELARRVGVKAASAYQWESGSTKSLKDTTLIELSDVLDVSPRWLATGVGPRSPLEHLGISRSETPEGYLRFQVMGAGGAGPGVLNSEEPEVLQEVDIAEWQVRQKVGRTVSPDRVKLLTVRGHSMTPRIKHGDVVFVDIEDRDPMDGGIFVVLLHGHALVKRIEIRRDGFHVVSLADPDHPDVYRPDQASDICIAGRVLGAIQMKRDEEL